MNNITLHSLMDKGSATSLLCRAVSNSVRGKRTFFSEELITHATDIIIPRNKQINFFCQNVSASNVTVQSQWTGLLELYRGSSDSCLPTVYRCLFSLR